MLRKFLMAGASVFLLVSCATGPVVLPADANGFANENTRPVDVMRKFGKPPVIVERSDDNSLSLVYPQIAIDAWTMKRAFEANCTIFWFGTDEGHNSVKFLNVHELHCPTATKPSNGRELTLEEFKSSFWNPIRMPANYRPPKRKQKTK